MSLYSLYTPLSNAALIFVRDSFPRADFSRNCFGRGMMCLGLQAVCVTTTETISLAVSTLAAVSLASYAGWWTTHISSSRQWDSLYEKTAVYDGVSPAIMASSKAVSISLGKYLIPLSLMDSFSRPAMFKVASSSRNALSPVMNQLSSVKAALVASMLL